MVNSTSLFGPLLTTMVFATGSTRTIVALMKATFFSGDACASKLPAIRKPAAKHKRFRHMAGSFQQRLEELGAPVGRKTAPAAIHRNDDVQSGCHAGATVFPCQPQGNVLPQMPFRCLLEGEGLPA